MVKETQMLCKNVFKNGNDKASKKEFTRCWIDLINHQEKNKKRRVTG